MVHFLFDQFLKQLVKGTKTKLDDKILELLRLPIFLSIFLIGLWVGLSDFQPVVGYRRLIISGIISFLLFLWAIRLIRIASLIIDYLGKNSSVLRLNAVLIKNLVKVVIWSVVLLVGLSIWGVNVTPLLASAGILGIALGLGAQETLANFFAGVAIMVDKPYQVRDYIVIQGIGNLEELRGEVINIGLRSTKIRTRDNVFVTVPNSVMARSVVVNETGQEVSLRLRIKVGVAYDSDIEKVEKILLKTVKQLKEGGEYVVNTPDKQPRVRFREFGDSALLFELLVWISEPKLKGRMTHFINKAVLESFRREKIVIPFPQRDIHFYPQK